RPAPPAVMPSTAATVHVVPVLIDVPSLSTPASAAAGGACPCAAARAIAPGRAAAAAACRTVVPRPRRALTPRRAIAIELADRVGAGRRTAAPIGWRRRRPPTALGRRRRGHRIPPAVFVFLPACVLPPAGGAAAGAVE